MDNSNSIDRAILATLGRQAFPVEELIQLVAPKGDGKKQLEAFNMCDGQTPQSEIAKVAKYDPGNLSRAISRWIDIGIMFRNEDGSPFHIYSIPTEIIRKLK